MRGGSWINNPDNCRSAYRNNNDPDNRNNNIGFRVVCLPQYSSRPELAGGNLSGVR
ncbi:MAG: SUMF1/EgtB/PvdO family nonheme iron enzyme [Cyanobacteria bacterium J06642_11]